MQHPSSLCLLRDVVGAENTANAMKSLMKTVGNLRANPILMGHPLLTAHIIVETEQSTKL